MTGFQQDKYGYYIYKDADAVKKYTLDWSKWLSSLDAGNITDAVWSADPGIVLSGASFTDKTTSVNVSGGVINKAYNVTCHVVTSNGQEDDKSFRVVTRSY